MDGILKATDYACRMHSNERRKNPDASPYINHPVEVAAILSKYGVTDEVTLQAALLHDTIENTEATYDDLLKKFSRAVADVVQEVSDDKSASKYHRKEAQLRHTKFKSLPARLVKLGDKISNTLDLNDNPPVGWSESQIQGYLQWSYAICMSILEAGDVPEPLSKYTVFYFEQIGVSSLDQEILDDYMQTLFKNTAKRT